MNTKGRITIETERLVLVCCDKEILEAYFDSEAKLAELLDINIPQKWTEFGEPAFRWTYDNITKGKAQLQWWSYLPVLKKENMLVGSCGYKGHPKNGMVEIGYEVAEAYRGKGLATEIAAALTRFAFQQEGVNKVQAHTLAMENESGTVLKKCGMKLAEEIEDPDDGKLWRWEINK